MKLNNGFAIKSLLQRVLPRKKEFAAVDIGSNQIKVAGIRANEEGPKIVLLRRYECPPGVWTDQFDEEQLVGLLSQIRSEGIKEVISCIGGEKVISRIVRFPSMSEKELAAAAENEVEKYLSSPADQFIFRYVRLDEGGIEEGEDEKGQSVLLLAVPAAAVYQYYGIFSRAGLIVTAFDLQAFALWRLFGRNTSGTLAMIDIGSRTSHLVITRDGRIRFIRVLPLGGGVLIKAIIEAYGVEAAEARKIQESASLLRENGWDPQEDRQLPEVLRGSLMEIVREIDRSLNFYAMQEGMPVERLILSGGTSKLRGLPAFMEDVLDIPVAVGTADLPLPEGEGFDPAYAVALGLALRGVC